ncbi:MAG: hypothetical protein CMO10_13990 [Thalassospira sp.]|nr:hypothetical protein [Thalassospira sp.]
MCDAFILFTVSELEAYLEGILRDSIELYENMAHESILKKCGAFSDFGEKFNKKKEALTKNNNANWSRISHFFTFIGLSRDAHFPQDFWDDVEIIVKHRGDLAHNGVSMKIIEDRRNVIQKAEEVIRKVRIFDLSLHAWILSMRSEVARLGGLSLKFEPEFE